MTSFLSNLFVESVINFSNNDISKFILFVRKGVYPYEYNDEWEKFNETSFPKKELFYNNLNMEDIADADYMHANRIGKNFGEDLKRLGEYHDLHLKNNTFLLADLFENFREMCLEIYQLDPAKFFSALGLAWQAALQNT